MTVELQKVASQLPWYSALAIDGRYRSKESGISGIDVTIQSVCNELTDILKLPRIPSAFLPNISFEDDKTPAYYSFWTPIKLNNVNAPLPPSINIPTESQFSILVEEIAHFVIDFYQTKGSDATLFIPNQIHRIRDVPLFDLTKQKFIYQHDVFNDRHLGHDNSLNRTYLLLHEALARTLVQLYFENAIESEPPMSATVRTEEKVFIVTIAGISFGVAHEAHKHLINIPELPANALLRVKTDGVLKVLKDCESEIFDFCKSIESYYSILPEEIGRPLWMQFVANLPVVRGLDVHNIGYQIGDRCAQLITSEPKKIETFKELVLDTTNEFPQTVKSLVEFALGA